MAMDVTNSALSMPDVREEKINRSFPRLRRPMSIKLIWSANADEEFTGDAETQKSEEKKIQKFACLHSSSSLRVSASPVNTFEKCKLKGRNGGTEKRENNGIFQWFTDLAWALLFPPFLRSSCSLSSDVGNDGPELV
jgi:hypothetical protein